MKPSTSLRTVAKLAISSTISLMGTIPVVAAQITWDVNATFTDGGSLTGSYVFDADTSQFTSINLIASAGSGYGPVNFVSTNATFPGSAGRPEFTNGPLNRLSQPELLLYLTAPMTDAGGAIGIRGGATLSAQYTCADTTCDATVGGSVRLMTGGTIASTPEPATVSLVLFGTLLLTGSKRIQTLLRRG